MDGVFRFLVNAVLGQIVTAWALVMLWDWFVAARFGLPLLGLAEVLGLSLIGRLLIAPPKFEKNYRKDTDTRTTREKWVDLIAFSVLLPVLAVGMGWIYRALM